MKDTIPAKESQLNLIERFSNSQKIEGKKI